MDSLKTKVFILTPFLLIAIYGFSTISTVDASELRTHILQAADVTKSGLYVKSRFLERLKKPFDLADKRPKLLVIGDSHAQDFFNTLLENNVDQRYQIHTRRIPGICGLYLGTEDISSLIKKKHLPNCKKSDTLAEAMPQIQKSDMVVLAANWKLWSVLRLPTTIKNLQIKSPQRLLVIGRKNFGKVNLRKYLRMPENELRQLRNPVHGAQQEINQIMRQTLPKNSFVDIQKLVCKSEDNCPLFTPQTKLISFDGGHLTEHGARYIGRILLQSPPLNQLIN